MFLLDSFNANIICNYGYINKSGIDDITLRVVNDPTINIHFKFIPAPNDIINYKYANMTYLADSKKRTLVLKSVRPETGFQHYSQGERKAGYVYPRSVKTYAAI